MSQKKTKTEKTVSEDTQIETFNIDKVNNFSEWFTEIVRRAELADMRYNVKGFIVYPPWSTISMKIRFDIYEK